MLGWFLSWGSWRFIRAENNSLRKPWRAACKENSPGHLKYFLVLYSGKKIKISKPFLKSHSDCLILPSWQHIQSPGSIGTTERDYLDCSILWQCLGWAFLMRWMEVGRGTLNGGSSVLGGHGLEKKNLAAPAITGYILTAEAPGPSPWSLPWGWTVSSNCEPTLTLPSLSRFDPLFSRSLEECDWYIL